MPGRFPPALPPRPFVPSVVATPARIDDVVQARPVGANLHSDVFIPDTQVTRNELINEARQLHAMLERTSSGGGSRFLATMGVVAGMVGFVFPPLHLIALPACMVAIFSNATAENQAEHHNSIKEQYTRLLEQLIDEDTMVFNAPAVSAVPAAPVVPAVPAACAVPASPAASAASAVPTASAVPAEPLPQSEA